jgi:hypothetical protein
VAVAQGEIEPGHPDISPTSSNMTQEEALVAVKGLKWTVPVSDYMSTSDVCWPHDPDLVDGTAILSPKLRWTTSTRRPA